MTSKLTLLLTALLALGSFAAMPAASVRNDCGQFITEAYHTPDYTYDDTPFIQVVFYDEPQYCGIAGAFMWIDERRVEPSTYESWWSNQYQVEYQVTSPLEPGPHTVTVLLFEEGFNVGWPNQPFGTATWTFMVGDVNIQVADNPDGTCTAYNDADGDRTADPQERLVSTPCPNPAYQDNGDGTHMLYDDRDNDGQPDPGETVLTTGFRDEDRDNIPDDTEGEICGPPGNRDFIDQWAPNLGSCPQNPDGTYTNYVAPDRFGGVNIPISRTDGPDLDRDGFPDTTTLHRVKLVIAPFTPGVVEMGPAPDLVLDTDTNDNDPNVPLLSTYTVPIPVVSGYTFSDDADRDGFPASVTLLKSYYTFDRRELVPVSSSTAPSETQPIDQADQDPNVPVQSEVMLPVALPSPPVFSADADGDGLPASVTITLTTYKYDRRDPAQLTPVSSTSNTRTMDPDDADKNQPVQRVVSIKLPTGIEGVDRDGDRIPGHFEITYLDLTVDSTNGGTSSGAHTETFVLEPNDDYRGAGPVNLDPYDGDRDDLPDALEPILCSRQNDNRPEDGVCPTADKQDYQAPVGIPNPWRRS